MDAATIPASWPVQPISPTSMSAGSPTTCGVCGLTWDDAVVTSMTPAPGGRCPFETFHLEDDGPDSGLTELWNLGQAAQDAAYGDSNDREIELLRDAMEWAFDHVFGTHPDGVDHSLEEEFPNPETVDEKLDLIAQSGWPIAYDGCHKLYFLQDDGRRAQAEAFGYSIYPPSEARRLFEGSCSLRFVTRWGYDNDDFDHPWNIEQFDDNEGDDL